MNIILEGIDGSGKTTLAEKLIEKYGMTSLHSTSQTKNDLDYHMDLLKSRKNTIFDRFQLGEMIFPIMYNRIGKLSEEDFKKINDKIIEDNDLIIVFVCSDHKLIADRLAARGENTEWEIDQQVELFTQFSHYFDNYENFYLIDVAQPNAYEKLDNWIDERFNKEGIR